ncbi:hypothetical protein ACIPPM_15675 [Streptomyces sp. NPDC090119]|uniref:hypothetical protein n=1 Tax=Streptomyces sp. NPDC090119 TaxID=3365951 RepID=UPI00381AC450
MLLVAAAAVLGVAVLSFVRVAPDAGPGTAEAEPRRSWKLDVEPSPGASATVVAVPSASPASAPRSARPTRSSPVGSSAEVPPTRPTQSPAPPVTSSAPRPPAAPHTTAPEASSEPEPPAQSAPAPAPTPTPSSTPPPPDKPGVCVPVLGLCLELRGR